MSLGGALAQCVAVDLSVLLNPAATQLQLVLFAAPRVGDDHFVKFLNERGVIVLRVEGDQYDDVVGFPYSAGLVGNVWKHAGIAVRINVKTDHLFDGSHIFNVGDYLYLVKPRETRSRLDLHNGTGPQVVTQVFDHTCYILSSRVPWRLGAGPLYSSLKPCNFHTRQNYLLHLLSACVMNGVNVHGCPWKQGLSGKKQNF